jgi:hypothetical protein
MRESWTAFSEKFFWQRFSSLQKRFQCFLEASKTWRNVRGGSRTAEGERAAIRATREKIGRRVGTSI